MTLIPKKKVVDKKFYLYRVLKTQFYYFILKSCPRDMILLFYIEIVP